MSEDNTDNQADKEEQRYSLGISLVSRMRSSFRRMSPVTIGQVDKSEMLLLGEFTMVSQPNRLILVDWLVFHFCLGRLPFFFFDVVLFFFEVVLHFFCGRHFS